MSCSIHIWGDKAQNRRKNSKKCIFFWRRYIEWYFCVANWGYFVSKFFCNQGSVQISLRIKSVEGIARAYARAVQPSFWFFAVTSVTQVLKKGEESRKMKRWKRCLSMEYGIEREDFNPNIVITSCLLGCCCRTVTLVTAKTIKLLLYARTREDFCVLLYRCGRIDFSICSKRASPAFYEKQAVVLWKVIRRFM